MKDNYKEILEYILKFIVESPKEIEITENVTGTLIDLNVKANKADYGTIIGKGGQMIQNIRKILTVKAVKDGVKINIRIDDEKEE
ncbi:KH domain-containing protein [Patescibacteria group bacterium]|nr:KH domain-containing protein [Patescibacteria group bacterium]